MYRRASSLAWSASRSLIIMLQYSTKGYQYAVLLQYCTSLPCIVHVHYPENATRVVFVRRMPPYFYMTSCTPRQYSILVRIHHYLVAGRQWYVCNLSCTQSCNMHLKKCNFATLINKPKCHRPTITRIL